MMVLTSIAVFTGTFAVSIYTIASTIAPRCDRIVSALRGEVQPMFLEIVR